MQISVRADHQTLSRQPIGVRVMLLTDRPDGPTAQRLASYSCLVDIEDQAYAALSGIIDDPMGYDLFVMDCDAFGGILAAERAIAALIAADAKMRVMLVSGEFDSPVYPHGLRTAVCLPEAVSEGGFRHGFDHVLRDRAVMTVM